MFTFQNVLSSGARMVCCTRALKADFRSRQCRQWLLNTHCWYTAAMSHGRKLYQPTTLKKNQCSMKNISYLKKCFQIVHVSSVNHGSRAIWTSSKYLTIEKVSGHHENLKHFSQNGEIQAYEKRSLVWKLLCNLNRSSQDSMKTTPRAIFRTQIFLLVKLNVHVAVLLFFLSLSKVGVELIFIPQSVRYVQSPLVCSEIPLTSQPLNEADVCNHCVHIFPYSSLLLALLLKPNTPLTKQ